MKKLFLLVSFAVLVAAADTVTNWIYWADGTPGVHVVTNALTETEVIALIQLHGGGGGGIVGGYVSSVNGETGVVYAATVAQGAKADAAVPRQDGASTNQTLMTATVPTFLSFTTNAVGALSAGQISWDSDWRTFKLGLGNGVENQVGQESQKLAKNVWTNTIPNGWAVMRSGAVGNSGKLEIVPAIATVGMSQGRVVGVATEDIEVGEFGLVTTHGNVNQIGSNGSLYGSSGWLDMADLYLSHVHQGYLMTNPPPAPYTVVFMGSVINAANNGAIDVSVHCGTSMQDLNDVNGTPLTQSGQFPVWDNVRQVFDFTGNTNLFLTEETDTLALGVIATNRPTVMADSYSPSYFQRLDNGTSFVYSVTGPVATYSVSLSSDFKETSGNTRPAWTNNVWPFVDSPWQGQEVDSETDRQFLLSHVDGHYWQAVIPIEYVTYPVTLIPASDYAVGSAVISQHVAMVTNVVSVLATTSNVNESVPAVYPYSQTVYGAVSVTNTEGYAGFITTNGAAKSVAVVPINTPATNTVSFSYPFTKDRITSASCVTYAQLGGGFTVADATMTLFDGATAVASNLVSAAGGTASGSRAYFTNSVSVAGSVVTNGSIVLSVTIGKASAMPAAFVSTGGSTPMTLTVQRAPLNYVTFEDLDTKVDSETFNNVLDGYVPTSQLSLTNGTVIYDGLYNGTNSVFFRTAAGTNYVLRLW